MNKMARTRGSASKLAFPGDWGCSSHSSRLAPLSSSTPTPIATYLQSPSDPSSLLPTVSSMGDTSPPRLVGSQLPSARLHQKRIRLSTGRFSKGTLRGGAGTKPYGAAICLSKQKTKSSISGILARSPLIGVVTGQSVENTQHICKVKVFFAFARMLTLLILHS